MMQVLRYFPLKNGLKMPSLGLGTYLLKGEALKEALDYALFLGYRHIDTAISYDNDVEIGEVIKERIKAGRLQRKDIFVTSKVQNLYADQQDIIQKVHQTQENLKLKHLDLLLIHHPWEVIFKDNNKKNTPQAQLEVAPYVDFCNTWKALESLHNEGAASSLGLSNFTSRQIERILDIAKIHPCNLQLEAHVYLQQEKLKQFCDTHQIVISAYAPLGSPNRPSRHVAGSENILSDPLILEIANAYKRTPAQVLLNFLLKCGMAVLPKSGNKERLKENLGSLGWSTSTQDFNRIQKLDCGLRFFKFNYMKGHPEFFENEDF